MGCDCDRNSGFIGVFDSGVGGISVLKKADLVFETREKNFIYYELNTSVVEEVMLWLSQLKGDNHESHS